MEENKERRVVIIPADPDMVRGEVQSFQQKRVAAYCRVSTDEDEQLLSYEAQCRYYKDKINMNKEWKLAGIFADEGITGTSTKKRKDFNRMIKLCEQGKIDVIITKSISRFARNTVDTLSYVRKLKAKGISVIFEKEGINTSVMTDEMILATMSMFAQAESESISKNVSAGIRYSYRAGKVSYRYPLYGYLPGPDRIPVIDEPNAIFVREIFDEFLKGKSIGEIKEYLESHNAPTAISGGKWNHSTIEKMLRNEKYCGDVLLQKTFIADCISKKVVVNNGQLPKYLVKNAHPAIVSRATFNAVQEELARRNCIRKLTAEELETKGKHSKFALTQMLICDECGTSYRRVTWSRKSGKKIVWRCVNRLENANKYCKESPTVEEPVLHAAILRVINRTVTNESGLQMLRQVLTRTFNDGKSPSDMYAAEAKLIELKNMMREMLDLATKTGADSDRYDKEFERIGQQIKDFTEIYEREKRLFEAEASHHEEVDAIYEQISQAGFQANEWDDTLVRKLFACIKVTPQRTIKLYYRDSKIVVEEPLEPLPSE